MEAQTDHEAEMAEHMEEDEGAEPGHWDTGMKAAGRGAHRMDQREWHLTCLREGATHPLV